MTLLALVFPHMAYTSENTADSNSDIDRFIDEMVQKHKFDHKKLTELFSRVKQRPSIIEAISRPAESKPWYKYRPIFLTDSRIRNGIQFWKTHAAILDKASQQYGIAPEIIVSIIGVETFYGQRAGTYPVIDALSTLAFGYPPRSDFFRGELEHYLLMTREEHLDPGTLKGSYAGAMGKAQFIPSSYRHYAVDFDGDGIRDLLNSTTDAIGSVANYLNVHGWQRDRIIAIQVKASRHKLKTLIDKGLKPEITMAKFRALGVGVPTNIPDDSLGALIELENRFSYEHWIGLQNFYSITRYNHSALYAMAVYQLSRKIRAGYRPRGN